MEPEAQTQSEPAEAPAPHPALNPIQRVRNSLREGRELHGVEWAIVGSHGLRVGWSILLFATLYYVFRLVIGTVFYSTGLVGDNGDDSAGMVVLIELVPFLALAAAMVFMGFFEGRRITSYNLSGSSPLAKFLSGTIAGFASLSLLVCALACAGWSHFSFAALPAAQDLHFALLWGCAFLLVGLVEEGLFRCYPLFTLSRGINFWWALAAQVAVCSWLALNGPSNGAWGVYLAAAIGLLPCLALHQKCAPCSGFWQAAWVTSTVFGYYHTANNGENWIGIFAAASIGFVLCVSVRLTGSAWWAIGCHAAWDWAETFFYGTANSGLQGQGHLFSAEPVGNPLWSGGADGPEGSLLVLGAILILLFILLAFYGRKPRAVHNPLPLAEESAQQR